MTVSQEIVPDFNPTPEPVGTGTESLGAWLARSRTGCNAEQRDVARHLGLNPTIIQALETDDFQRLGPPVFVRGYLGRYARLLNLPEQAVLERYRLQSGASDEPPPLKVVHPLRRQARIRDLRGVFYLLLLVGIAWTAIQNLDSLDPSRLLALWSDSGQSNGESAVSPATTANSQTQFPFLQSEPASATAATGTPTSLPLVKESPPASNTDPIPPTPTKTNPSPPPIPASPASPAEPTAPAAASGVVATIGPSTSGSTLETGDGNSPSEAKLLLEFSNDCWVEVKDAQGNVLANGLMKANSTHNISGAAPFKVTLGNAPAARIILDNRLVDTDFYVPRRGTVSRFTLDRGQP